MERSGNFYKAIRLGYILISILIGCMAYNKMCIRDRYYSPVSTPADFRQLTPYVFRLALQQSGVDVLEPMLCFGLQIPQVARSKAITDLQKLMSEIEDISCNNELSLIHICTAFELAYESLLAVQEVELVAVQ